MKEEIKQVISEYTGVSVDIITSSDDLCFIDTLKLTDSEIFHHLEGRFDCYISESEMSHVDTVGDLIQLVYQAVINNNY